MPSLAELLVLLIPELGKLEQAEIDELNLLVAGVSSPLLKAALQVVVNVADEIQKAAIAKLSPAP